MAHVENDGNQSFDDMARGFVEKHGAIEVDRHGRVKAHDALELSKIQTYDKDGQPTGYLMPIWNCHENEWRPDQVYLTVIDPMKSKGPHLHKKRCGRFICVRGTVAVIMRLHNGEYRTQFTGDEHRNLITVPPGVATELVNLVDMPAFVLNMPTPAWRPDDQDEWPVFDWHWQW